MLLDLLAVQLLLSAQASQSSIAGVVRDAESGAPLVEAVVSLDWLACNWTITPDTMPTITRAGV